MQKNVFYALAIVPNLVLGAIAVTWWHFNQKDTALEFETGLRTLSLSSKHSKVQLPIELTTTPVCYFGDSDLLKLEAKYSKHRNLLLSVEGIGAGGDAFTPITKVISSADLEAGRNLTIEMPAQKTPQTLGIFICSDTRGSGTCRDKKVIFTGVRMRAYYGITPGEKQKTLAIDKVFYFQMLIAHGSKIKFPSLSPMPDHMYDLLSRYLESRASLKPTVAMEMIDDVKRLDRTTGSIPAYIDKDKVHLAISLTKFDSSRCKQ